MVDIVLQHGGPGTGKSRYLSAEAAQAGARYGADKVLACSLSRSAARLIGHTLELPYEQYGTIHGHAYRALGSPELAEGHIAEWNAQFPEWELSGHKRLADDAYEIGSKEAKGDKHKRDRTPGFLAAWQDWKDQCGYLDFNDLLSLALTETVTAPGDPAVILLDEGQDTSAPAMRLVWHWAKKAQRLVVCYDSAQAIFSFLGGDALICQKLQAKFDADRKPLGKTYRLSQAVYECARRWQTRFVDTLQVDYTPTDEAGWVHRAKALDKWTESDVARLLDENPGKDVMFLTTCGYMLDPLMTELRAAGIPFHNPMKPNNGKFNPLPQQRKRGHTVVDRVLAFSQISRRLWGDRARFWSADELKVWTSALMTTGVLKRGGAAAIGALPSTASDEDISAAFSQWFTPEALPKVVPEPDLNWYMGHIKGSDNLRDFVKTIIARQGVSALKERPRVKVGTIHSLKGDEADIAVISPNISTESWKYSRRDPAIAEELRRVIYVALTRAKTGVYLCAPDAPTTVGW